MSEVTGPVSRPLTHKADHLPAVADAHSDGPRAKPAQPKPVGRGSADGQNTTWSEAPLHLGRIDNALDQLSSALAEEAQAAARRTSEHRSEASIKEYNKAHEKVYEAGNKLGAAIEDETERGSRRGPFSASPRSADVRHRAERLAAAYAGKKGERDVLKNIELDQEVRVGSELSHVSEAAKHPPGSHVRDRQAREFNDILDDAADLVTRRRQDDGPGEAELKARQFSRLESFLKNLTKDYKDLDKGVFATVVIRCANAMNISSRADLETLEGIVRPYSNQAVTNWINTSMLVP